MEQWTFDDPKIVKHFDNHIRSHLPWYDQMQEAVAYLIKNYLPQNGSIVDFGASTGNLIEKILPTVIERNAGITAIDNSYDMIRWIESRFNSELKGGIIQVRHTPSPDFHDVHVACLVLSFLPVNERQIMIDSMIKKTTKALIIVDKIIDHDGYLAAVLRRLTMQMKINAGVGYEDALKKEMALAGVQIPLDPRMLGEDAKQFFRMGEFAGWIIEKE